MDSGLVEGLASVISVWGMGPGTPAKLKQLLSALAMP